MAGGVGSGSWESLGWIIEVSGFKITADPSSSTVTMESEGNAFEERFSLRMDRDELEALINALNESLQIAVHKRQPGEW